MEKSVCLACVLVSLTCLVIILLIGCILIFYLKQKKLRNYDQTLTNSSQNYRLNLTKLPYNRQMTARRNYIFTSKYIPIATKIDLKWYDWYLNTCFNELKFKEATDNPDQYFSNVELVNFISDDL